MEAGNAEARRPSQLRNEYINDNLNENFVLAMAAIAAPRSVGGGGEGMQLVAGLQALNQLLVVDWGEAAGVHDAPG